MKRKTLTTISRILAATLVCGFFLFFLFRFSQPLSSIIYDLSIYVEDGSEWDGDTKGWEFYCENKDGGKSTLEIDSGGSCLLPSQGVTFSYSRTMTEVLSIPQLTVEISNCNIAVLLDGEVLYNDCQAIDVTRPGAQLESVDWDRFDTVNINLPDDYRGKTLTIMQSTPSFSETEGPAKGYICNVHFANDGAQSSELISSGYTLAIHALLLFIGGAVTFCGSVFRREKSDYSYIALSLTAFFQLINLLAGSGYWNYYIAKLPFDAANLANSFSLLALLIFLVLRINRRSRVLWAVCAAVFCVTVLDYLSSGGVLPFNSFLMFTLPAIVGCVALMSMYIYAIVPYRRKDLFFRTFIPSIIAIAVIWSVALLIALALGMDYAKNAVLQLQLMLSNGSFGYILHKLHMLGLIAAVISACISLLRLAAQKHAQVQFIKDRGEMALASYQQLSESDRQTMMLHHDMNHHLTVMSEMDNPEELHAYITQLIGQIQNIQTVFRSGNSLIDTILNGKLNVIDREQISIEVVRCHAPEKLKLSETELCSVMMNVIENAVNGALDSGAGKPFIRLDLHVKDDVFVCTVENSAKPQEKATPPQNTAEALPAHGWGLRIIWQIMERHGYPVDARQNGDVYKVMLTILCDTEA